MHADSPSTLPLFASPPPSSGPLVCLYLQLHQPCRLRRDYRFFDVGRDACYFDPDHDRAIMERVAERSYVAAGQCLLRQVVRLGGRFRFALSLSGICLEQMARWAPDALRTFQALVATGCVELLSETSHHSLAALVDPAEFRAQVVLHRRRLRHFFGAAAPTTFRNTELIVRDDVVRQVADLGYRVLLAEGCPRLLGDRDPHRVHRLAAAPGLRLLARDARRSDDLAFRFRRPRGGTLRPDVYARLLRRTAPDAANAVVNLFMDFETFGEHLKADSGVLDFLDAWPAACLAAGLRFATPAEVVAALPPDPGPPLTIPDAVSWADVERDLSAWLGNPLQDAALADLQALGDRVRALGDRRLRDTWRRLQTSDHFYYMCTKADACGAVHAWFTPFATPHDAWLVYTNVLNDFRLRLATLEARRG